MKIIQIQPAAYTDNVWVSKGGQIVEGQKTPYPFAVLEDGSVDDQNFWRGDPSSVIGFQHDDEVQRVDIWWSDVVADPELAVGRFPVMTGPDGIYTYTLPIESVEVFEVPA